MAAVAAGSVVLAGFQWFASSPFMADLLKKGYSYLGMDVDVVEKLQDLQNIIIPQMEMLIEAGENSPQSVRLHGWLKSLEEAVYEAEDVLDLYDYYLLKQKVKSNVGGITVCLESLPLIKDLLKNCSDVPRNIKLKKSLMKLEKSAVKAKEFLPFLPAGVSNVRRSEPTNESARRVTTSLLANKVFGRDKDRDHIIGLLHETAELEPESSFVKNYSVVAIVGLGGAGKTTLAQYACDYERDTEYFDVIMWVHVSQRLDVKKLTREMVESASGKECPRLDNLDTLQRKLEDSLRSKKFLLILDDVWSEKEVTEVQWGQLLAPLNVGNKGSKILMTTREKGAAEALGARNILHLEELEQSDFLDLFMYYALDDAKVDNNKLYRELKEIVRQSAPKLHGSPLAARMVASQLRKRTPNVDFWKRTLSEDLLKDTMKSLLWSYQNLEAHLQRCFSYCSLFFEDEYIAREDIIRRWIAEGFTKTSEERKRMEEVGREYFDDLVSRSFFQPTKSDSIFTMHDLLRELAEKVSKDRCLRVETNLTKAIPQEIRHLSILIDGRPNDLTKTICNLKNLRTLIVRQRSNDDCIDDLVHSIFVKLKKLRVVDLSRCTVKNLPESIGSLKHLRHLDLRESNLEFLPKSVSTLYHLEFLHVRTCTSVPKELTNLVSLSHVIDYGRMLTKVAGIGKLTSLQSLDYFEVKKERGYELKQLENLRELQGSLHISGLENVEGKEKALESKLEEKMGIERLGLAWSIIDDSSRSSDMDAQVLEGLRPPSQLRILDIIGYQGRIYPSWMAGDSCLLHNLKSLELKKCRQLEFLPADMAISFHYLNDLVLSGLEKLKKLPILPPNLTKLVLDACSSLALGSKDDIEIIRSTQERTISQVVTFREGLVAQKVLHSFPVRDSLGLQIWFEKSIDNIYQNLLAEEVQLVLPSSLQQLEIASCELTNSALRECLQGLTSLTHLKISSIVSLTSLSSADVLSGLATLRKLEIIKCWFLTSLGGLQALSSLKELVVVLCPNLSVELPARGGNTCLLPSSLEVLRMIACNSNNLDDFLQDATSLITLRVMDCLFMASIQLGHLKSLVEVNISNCPELKLLLGFQKFEHLEILTVQKCPKLTPTTAKLADVHLPRLRSFTTDDPSLISLVLADDGHTSLSSLVIKDMGKESLSAEHAELFEHLTSLSALYFINCSVNSLPGNLEKLSSLEFLRISKCPNIVSLPDLPKSLNYLSISWCSPVLQKRCQDPDGEDWHRIAHIPHRYID